MSMKICGFIYLFIFFFWGGGGITKSDYFFFFFFFFFLGGGCHFYTLKGVLMSRYKMGIFFGRKFSNNFGYT